MMKLLPFVVFASTLTIYLSATYRPVSIAASALQIAFAIELLRVALVKPMRRRRMRKLLRGHDYAVCLSCRYPLVGLADAGVCPECGTGYDVSETRRCWEEDG